MQLISIVIRTLDEERHLDELLCSIRNQKLAKGIEIEVVIIDSGSTDRTLQIAENHGCKITHIEKHEFTFGRSLNAGSAFSGGSILVYISGHCVPTNSEWLMNLISPLLSEMACYSYGRQVGRDTTKYSERQLFQKYYPQKSRVSQSDIFCNNANAAIVRSVWESNLFDEEILGLEDMDLSRRLVEKGEKIAYASDAIIYHIHDETWGQTRRRYEREAIALQKIMPEVHVSFLDTLYYIFVSVLSDWRVAMRDKCLLSEIWGIPKFRVAQYWGAYRGNHEHRKLSQRRKFDYYYPNKVIGD